jgi:hypothetical protein
MIKASRLLAQVGTAILAWGAITPSQAQVFTSTENMRAFEPGLALARGATFSIENSLDVRGFRLGDTRADLNAEIKNIIAEYGSATNVQERTQLVQTHQGPLFYEYLESISVLAQSADTRESLSFHFGTPASGATVDHVSRLTLYTGRELSSVRETVKSIFEKYGTPTTYMAYGNTQTFGYYWLKNKLVPMPEENGAVKGCRNYQASSVFVFPAEKRNLEDCSAILLVSVTSDGEGRLTMLSQDLISPARQQRDFNLSDAAIRAALGKDFEKAGGKAAEL